MSLFGKLFGGKKMSPSQIKASKDEIIALIEQLNRSCPWYATG